MRNALCSVAHEDRAVLMGDVRKLPDIITYSQDIGDLRHCDDLCPRAHGASEALLRDAPIHIALDKAKDRTLSLRSLLPGQKIAVVLHDRDQDLISLLQKDFRSTVSDEIQALTRIPCENDLLCALRPDKTAGRFSRILIGIRSGNAQCVETAERIRIFLLIESLLPEKDC